MTVRVLRFGIHSGEESLVKGNDRSGMVVFSGCHLACSFCYTPETSRFRQGEDYDADGFERILESLITSGAHNINLISPTHVWNAIEPVLEKFKKGMGAHLPLVLKFSGFESPALIRRFARLADILVPDFKVWEAAKAVSVALPSQYGEVAQKAVAEMLDSHMAMSWEQGVMRRGILLRHLLMPDFETDSFEVLRALGAVGYESVLNLMTCFISPDGRLVRAPRARVEALVAQAQSQGMYVLVDGDVVQRLQGESYGRIVG